QPRKQRKGLAVALTDCGATASTFLGFLGCANPGVAEPRTFYGGDSGNSASRRLRGGRTDRGRTPPLKCYRKMFIRRRGFGLLSHQRSCQKLQEWCHRLEALDDLPIQLRRCHKVIRRQRYIDDQALITEQVGGGMIAVEALGNARQLVAVEIAEEPLQRPRGQDSPEFIVMNRDVAADGEQGIGLGHVDAARDFDLFRGDTVKESVVLFGQAASREGCSDVILVRSLVF